MILRDLIQANNIRTALIVDDGYDLVPTSKSMAGDDEAWDIFFTDLNSEDRDVLQAVHPSFQNERSDTLRRSDSFICTLWGLQDRLQDGLWQALFDRFKRDSESDTNYLRQLEEALERLGITPIRSGSAPTIPVEGRQAPLVFMDLFLGVPQDEGAMSASIERLTDVLTERAATPPIVVLMSRSSRLETKREVFRDKAGLIGAMFRVLRKEDLAETGVLERTLERLVRHREDGLRLAAFLHAWQCGLSKAKRSFEGIIRRLDLADYGQLTKLLLEHEGQPLGSYLLDICDRILMHEIEAQGGTIDAAEELGKIGTQWGYAPPHLGGSENLLELVYSATFQNPKRLRVRTNLCNMPVSFGDVVVKQERDEVAVGNAAVDEAQTTDAQALIVLTPACDLVREGGTKRVLLMGGTTQVLTPNAWKYKNSGCCTPCLKAKNGQFLRVQWNPKDLQMLEPRALRAMLETGGGYEILGRLREVHALELQQQVLSTLGRVGLVAQLPASFAVQLTAYTVDIESSLRQLSVPSFSGPSILYTGRDKDSGSVCHLVLSEAQCDELRSAIRSIERITVHPKATATLDRILSEGSFSKVFERGIRFNYESSTKTFVEIKTSSEGDGIFGLITGAQDLGVPTKVKDAALVLRWSMMPATGEG